MIPAARLILARHGESEANLQYIFSNSGYRHGLTIAGCAEAQTLAERLIGSFPRISRIYTSPLRRAIDTA